MVVLVVDGVVILEEAAEQAEHLALQTELLAPIMILDAVKAVVEGMVLQIMHMVVQEEFLGEVAGEVELILVVAVEMVVLEAAVR